MDPLVIRKFLRQLGPGPDLSPSERPRFLQGVPNLVPELFVCEHGRLLSGPIPIGTLAFRTHERLLLSATRNPFMATPLAAVAHYGDRYSCHLAPFLLYDAGVS